MDKAELNNYYMLAAIGVVLLIIYLIYSNVEKFEEEDTSVLDKTEVLEECKDMNAEKMFKLFNEDLNYLTQVFVDNDIPLKAIKDVSYYPKIASLLVRKGILKCV
jgi:predicted membrane protein